MKTIAEVSNDTLKIEVWLQDNAKPDTIIPYTDIEIATGVIMNEKGKANLRSALRRLKLEYASVKGIGIKMAGCKSAMELVGYRMKKIDNATNRADKCITNIRQRYFDELDEQDQKNLIRVSSLFGAIKATAIAFKDIYKKPKTIKLTTPQVIDIWK